MLNGRKRPQKDSHQGSTQVIHSALSATSAEKAVENEALTLADATSILDKIRVELIRAEEAPVLIECLTQVLDEEAANLDRLIKERQDELEHLVSMNRKYEESNRAIEAVIKNKK